jgi:hypothetical protein
MVALSSLCSVAPCAICTTVCCMELPVQRACHNESGGWTTTSSVVSALRCTKSLSLPRESRIQVCNGGHDVCVWVHFKFCVSECPIVVVLQLLSPVACRCCYEERRRRGTDEVLLCVCFQE